MNPHPHISLERATQLALFLSNRPGAIAKVCEERGSAEINIRALSISDTVDHSIVRMVVSDTTKALVNVTCEGCHGPGSLHVAAPIAEKKNFIAKPGEAMCKQCHTAVTTPSFAFADFVKRGVHQVPVTPK